ncbi:zinc/manganese transport system substrate-binding protein [Aureimonas jatrophae]|uniref:Zinc/manganese transport system substrate-binding protein n=2 Tax=Aureimonas jatrophae TaxID=1166073 RepID=A0A1H0HC15_9HYPH|nr:zinc/manganese transport system substrate-binding protein [Aureimonas jatrophae]
MPQDLSARLSIAAARMIRSAGLIAGACLALLTGIPAACAEPLRVVASFSILGDLAREVGGEHVVLTTLVGPDGDAHVYEPRPADARALAAADVVLVNGLLLEGFLPRLLAASGTKAPAVEVSRGAAILADPEGGHYHVVDGQAVFHATPNDPHAWQSVHNAKVYVGNIARAFCEADRARCASYEANAVAYGHALDALDAEIRQTIDAFPADRRVGVVAHNAFRYFERDYGVRFLSPQGLSTEAEASAADVASLVREIRAGRAVAAFAENISNARLVERIAAEAGIALGGTLYSDALSKADGPAPSYAAMMRHNARTIAAALAVD